MGATPGMIGTARGQSQLRQAFELTNSCAMPPPEVLVARAREKFDDNGTLTDEATKKFVRQMLEAFETWTERLQYQK